MTHFIRSGFNQIFLQQNPRLNIMIFCLGQGIGSQVFKQEFNSIIPLFLRTLDNCRDNITVIDMVHLPMFIQDPHHGIINEKRNTLVQNIDVPITLLRAFGLSPSKDMMGHDLEPVIVRDQKVRDYALFGMHRAQVNITDGRYVYMRSSVAGDEPLYNYTQMPTHMRSRFSVAEMKTMRPHHGFSFTKGTPVMGISAMEDASGDTSLKKNPSTVLFDLLKDPGQTYPINDQKTEVRMIQNMIELMKDNDAPREQYIRLGLDAYV